MDNNVYTKTYDAPIYDKREIYRYAGVSAPNGETERLLEECLNELGDKLTYKVCYRELPVSVNDGVIDLGFAKTDSRSLLKALDGCDSIVLFAASIGVGMDRLIARYSSLSPAKALLFQAIGTEQIESLCDVFQSDIASVKAESGKNVRPRFSPGYGDLPLELQRDVFNALDCKKRIGLALCESLLMTPSKSVTAIIGIG